MHHLTTLTHKLPGSWKQTAHHLPIWNYRHISTVTSSGHPNFSHLRPSFTRVSQKWAYFPRYYCNDSVHEVIQNLDLDRDKLKKARKEAKQAEKDAKKQKALLKQQQQQQQKQQQEKRSPPLQSNEEKTRSKDSYDPPSVESNRYSWWLEKGYFSADNKSTKEPFVIVIPPPNVTGELHLGHALTQSVQDAIVRWNRMNGKNALYVPGLDHAGIATQVVVEKRLKKAQNVTRHDIGREKFVEQVWKWKDEYAEKINRQLKRIGSSLDWEREVFTMDEKRSKAVTEAFVRFFEDGLIYRDKRLVNWCCVLKTAIADTDTDNIQIDEPIKMRVPGHGDKEYEFGWMWNFAYPLEDGSGEIVVSTTRPETMLADTAVAIHPDDPRYKKLHGCYVIHPFDGRRLPIITDRELVKTDFGTGAVKVTPAHDLDDFACGKRHNLDSITLFDDDGKINKNGGAFQGMQRFDCRNSVLEELRKKGLLRGQKPNPMTLKLCMRSKDVIELISKEQWFLNCKTMAETSIKAVREGQLKIMPSMHVDTWYRWLENIRDWCISRQLWWGHRCPAYLIITPDNPNPDSSRTENWVVGRTHEEAMQQARLKYPEVRDIRLVQDNDVLDTWFSSGLFPLASFGWPDMTEDFKAFYPTTLLETGHDILFFWVARMVMMATHLTGKLPFREVYLHAMVRDAHGKKMSKSLGNVIDPIDVIEGITLEGLWQKLAKGNLDPREYERAKKAQAQNFPKGIPQCGADAMRFALCSYTTQGRDINLDINRVYAYRTFCNKLWNAMKFALIHLGNQYVPLPHEPEAGQSKWEEWILSRLNFCIIQTNEAFKMYDFAMSTNAIYNFWLYEFCDVFLETLKPVMQGDSTDPQISQRQHSAREVLYTCLDNGLRLLHPFMPFVTEELWQMLNRRESLQVESIMISPYPKEHPNWKKENVEIDTKIAQEIIHAARRLKANFGASSVKSILYINLHSDEMAEKMKDFMEGICFLTRAADVILLVNRPTPEGCAVEVLNECEIFLQIKGTVNIEVEIEKLEKKKGKLVEDLEKWMQIKRDPDYHKVPQHIQQENDNKVASLQQELQILEQTSKSFKSFL